MFVIKDTVSGNYAKHNVKTCEWELTDNINKAQQFSTLEWANEVAYWHLDYFKMWVIVDKDSKEEFSVKVGKYHP